MTIAENLTLVRNKIAAARARSGHAAPAVKLLAVSKTHPIEKIAEAYAAGQRCFGENRVQELTLKIAALPELEWHLIGHLQTNKVKYIIGKTALIHSLDSLDLAIELEKRGAALDVVSRVLVQLNIAEEDTKSGLHTEELADFLDALSACPHVRAAGLMTIGPFTGDREEIRRVFAELRRLRDREREKGRPYCRLEELSMGMSGDYEIAVEEGSSIVRVGSDIFGARIYPQNSRK